VKITFTCGKSKTLPAKILVHCALNPDSIGVQSNEIFFCSHAQPMLWTSCPVVNNWCANNHALARNVCVALHFTAAQKTTTQRVKENAAWLRSVLPTQVVESGMN
jgi:hypothetical protein